MVVPEHDWELVRSRFGDGDVRLLAPTPELPALLGDADIVVSAAGTSTWDLCALGLPSVLIAVVDNQAEPLAQATSAGLTLGISAVENSAAIGRELLPCLVRLLEDEGLRRTLSVNCVGAIDGLGKARVVERLESALHQGRS